MGEAQKLLTGEKISVEEFKEIVRKRRGKWRGRYAHIERHTGVSGEETVREEPERISSYLTEELKKKIIEETIKRGRATEETVERAVDYLMSLSGFDKLFMNVPNETIEWFKDWLGREYFTWEKLKRKRVALKSRERIPGMMLERRKTYVIPIERYRKKFYQIRDWETGRILGTYRART